MHKLTTKYQSYPQVNNNRSIRTKNMFMCHNTSDNFPTLLSHQAPMYTGDVTKIRILFDIRIREYLFLGKYFLRMRIFKIFLKFKINCLEVKTQLGIYITNTHATSLHH